MPSRRSAEAGPDGCSSTMPRRRSSRFLLGLENARRAYLVSHVQPDPDSLGSMVGLAYLIESCQGIPTQLTCDGQIYRAENRAMVQLLNIELLPVEDMTWGEGDILVMVDSQPNTGRHSFDPSLPLYGVIDHHETAGDLNGVSFTDIRRGVGATSSIVTSYLMERELTVPRSVATALLYGIETDLEGYPREASSLDDSALAFLYPLADKNVLAQIRSARLPQAYFECFLQALQTCFIYDRLIISWVRDMPQPEMAAEVVDFLIRFEEVDWAVCAGVCGDQLVLSVRTALPQGEAGEMLQQVVGKLGRAGGHQRRAGGTIPLASTSTSAIDDLYAELRRRLLKALRIDECRGQRLIHLRDMLQNLQS